MGAFREPVNKVAAGNLVALTGLEQIQAGETIVDVKHKKGMVPFEQLQYVSEPVITIAIEPKNPTDLPQFLAAIDQLVKEDPNLVAFVNKETGEHLLSGMGELHLEITVNHLRRNLGSMEISASLPRVVYQEKATHKGIVSTALSPNKQNKFTVQVEPVPKKINTAKNETRIDSVKEALASDDYENILVDCTGKKEQMRGILDFIISGFTFACNAGPLCGESIRSLQVNLLDFQLDKNNEYENPVEVERGIGKAIFGSFLTAGPVLLEPVYKTLVLTPEELAGNCSKILNSRRGKIFGFEQKGAVSFLTSYIPVAGTFGLSKELRSATSGRAFWQFMFDHWEKMPEKIEAKIIEELRKRKGLPLEVPIAKRFLEEKQ
jgi:elongation factor 2